MPSDFTTIAGRAPRLAVLIDADNVSAVNAEAILNEIAAFYNERSDIVPKAKQFLAGVPGQVQHRELEDWHSDAMGLNS